MKKAFVLSVLFIAALSACQKTTDSLNHPTTYRVDGITDVVMAGDSGSVVTLGYNVIYIGPVQETVTLGFDSLPAGIMIDTAMQNSITGIPNFQSVITLIKTDTNNRKGIYNIKLTCKGSITGKKSYDLKLKVLANTTIPVPPVTHCDSSLSGTWDSCMDFCSGNSYVDVLNVDGTIVNRIHFTNFQNFGIDVYADLNCSSNTFVIPHQTFAGGSAAISGNGSFIGTNFISINVTDSSALGVTPCSVTMKKH